MHRITFAGRERIANPSPSTVRNRRMRDRLKDSLIAQLGGRCAQCGAADNLTFDHIHGRTWSVRSVHASKRLRIYQREADQGLIQLLCLSCNSKKGDPRQDDWDGSF